MELKDFIRESLTQIVDGALSAHETVQKKKAAINPDTNMGGGPGTAGFSMGYGLVQYVEFDVALADSEKQSSEGGIGVFLGSFGIGGKTGKGTEASALTRIKFRIPLALPTGR